MMSQTVPALPTKSWGSSKKLWKVAGLMMFGFLVVFLVSSMEMSSVEDSTIAGVQVKKNSTMGTISDGDQQSSSTRPITHRRTYVPRGRLHVFGDTEMMGNETVTSRRQAMTDQWGSWTLVDEKKDRRPQEDFYAKYQHRDVPRMEFPANAWQFDADFLAKFVPESIKLVERGQKAIMAEYGQDPATSQMFQIFRHNSSDGVTETGEKQGGWTTHTSWQGLVKRILHAIITEDVFVFAMGGHSAAAGHGNHFQQSYILQVQWILESIFARMGVQFIARNFGNGGLGTVHNGMAAGDIYGQDVDMLMWDSGMTEKSNGQIDLLHRQGLLASPHKVPVLWTKSWKIAVAYNLAAGVEVGIPGSGMKGLNYSSTYEDLEAQPFAARYLKCNGQIKSVCGKNRYDGVCWIDRPDVTPQIQQDEVPGGRAGWHPGNREHQLFGRVLAYTILEATKDALNLWRETDGWMLADDTWHVTAHYQGLRNRIASMPLEKYYCKNFGALDFVCKYPVKARTEFTPRAFAGLTSIRSLMPPEMRVNVNDAPSNIYQPPDVFNPSLHPPLGEVDVLSIVEAGVPFEPILAPTWAQDVYKKPKFSEPSRVPVGQGIQLDTRAGDEFCDGSLDSFCSRGEGDTCLLRAHNDGRNGLSLDGYSGWMVMNIPDLLHGHIVIKIETWHQPGSLWKTEGWEGINGNNNETDSHRSLSLEQHPLQANESASHKPRRLKKKPPELAEDFKFQYAINGNITEWDKGTFLKNKQDLARVVEMVVLLDDPTFTGGVETEVEVAIRILGSGRQNTFKLTHIYWT